MDLGGDVLKGPQMKSDVKHSNRSWRATEQLRRTVQSILSKPWKETGKQALAALLCALLLPMSQIDLYAQEGTTAAQSQQGPPPAGPNAGAQAQAQPLTPDQLNQLVAPIALYPDALVAQILGASTYPTQVVEADRWRASQASATPQQIATEANNQNWDPSVKALTAFPTVLAQMDKNLEWTTNLGNAYYNQPQDVMDAVQAMRHRAQSSGNLKSTSQQAVSTVNDNIVIAPATPTVVYVPAYNPWLVYGPPLPVYPGFYYAPPPGVIIGAGIAIGFGVGIGIGAFRGFGWGWHNWRCGWHSRAVIYNHTTFITHSRTVINRGFNRPGGPARGFGRVGGFQRAARFNNRPGQFRNHVQTQHINNTVSHQTVQRSGFAGGGRSFAAHNVGGGRPSGGHGHR
jgi:Protein of unknown function (DUF3300)